MIRSLPRIRASGVRLRASGVRIRASGVALVAALVFVSCSSAKPPAATIEGERITDEQLAHDVSLFSFLAALNQGQCGQPVSGESADSACARFTLSNVIQIDLAKHYASAHSIKVDDTSVADTISQLETGLGGAAKLDAQLKASGITRTDLTDLARRLLLFGAVRTAVGAQSVSDAQLQQLYEQSKTQFTQLHVEHILLKTQAEAERIAKQATPVNFGALAKKYSIDPTAKQNAGDLGTVPASQLDQTFVATALALTPGEISQPVQTQYGWHVILLVDAPQIAPFEQVRDQLVTQASGQAFDTWLRGQLLAAEITVNPKYGRFDPTTGEVAPIRSTATGSATPTAAGSTP